MLFLRRCDREHRADLKAAFEADPEREFYQALFETEFAREGLGFRGFGVYDVNCFSKKR